MPVPTSRRRLLGKVAARAGSIFRPDGAPAGDVLVVVFLRGGMDGLHVAPPLFDPHYRRVRPTLAIRDSGPGAALPLGRGFGLHPDLRPLYELFQGGRLALVHGIGSPDTTLSHFEAMQTMERGVSDGSTIASGWISRHLAAHGGAESPVRAVAFGDVLPKSLQGSLSASAVRSLSEFRLTVPDGWRGFRSGLHALYAKDADPAAVAGRNVLTLLRRLEALDPAAYRPEHGARYPETELARGLRQVAQLVKADVGLEVACVDLGGWDAHVAQVALMTGLMQDLAGSLRAFHDDLGDRMGRVTLAAMTEFGRRAHENSGLGTDHGRGSAMFLLGAAVRGGCVYGRWPGLGPGELDRDGNLRVTTDYRDVLGELVVKRLSGSNLEAVFPGHSPQPLDVFTPSRETTSIQAGERPTS